MMGKKERHFALLINVSLEELVPQDHFYRHLERTLDLINCANRATRAADCLLYLTISDTCRLL